MPDLDSPDTRETRPQRNGTTPQGLVRGRRRRSGAAGSGTARSLAANALGLYQTLPGRTTYAPAHNGRARGEHGPPDAVRGQRPAPPVPVPSVIPLVPGKTRVVLAKSVRAEWSR